MTIAGWHIVTVLLAGFATLAVFSFLIKENPFYRFFEHLFIGIAAGLGVVVSIKNFLWPKVLVPLLGLDIVRYPDGSLSGAYNGWNLLFLAPMAFGLLYYFIYSQRYSWLAKLVIGFSLGASGGIAFKGFFNEMIPQLSGSFKPLLVFSGPAFQAGSSLSNAVFVFTLLAVMVYFLFSFRLESRALTRVSLCGRWLMMVSFGAFFGSTIMARMALLVERLQFLINEWAQTLFTMIAGRAG